jgi:RNA polymerase sigma-70 factor (ECF subfamily)
MALDAARAMNGLIDPPKEVSGFAATTRPVPPELDAVYAEHFDFVWRNLRRLGVSEQQLRDAAQDVFVVVHRRLPEWDGAESMRPWLYSIVRRVASDTRRRQRRKGLPESEDVHALIDSREAGPESNAARNQELSLLLKLLERLDPDKREVLILVDLEEMGVPEVSAVIGINTNTAYSRLRAARQAMREGYALFAGRERNSP